MKSDRITINKNLSIVELSEMVKVASCFNGEIVLIKDEEEINFKKILPLIGTKLSKNDIIEVRIKGERENEFYDSFLSLIKEIIKEDAI